MRVAFFVYPSAFQNKGGGEILLEKTEEYLIKKGIEVKRFDMWSDKIENYDILHVFGSVKECLGLMLVARSRGVKVVLESIFWSDIRRAFFEYGSLSEKAAKVMRHTMKLLCPAFPSSRRKMFLAADMIFPNSDNEARQISRLFGIKKDKMFVVPNGVDAIFAAGNAADFTHKYGLKDFVLYTGRIEPRKNQLNLIRAMKGVDRDLVLIGDRVSAYGDYYDRCRKEAGERTHFIPRMDHDSDLFRAAYAACEVFVLPGWFETPGLAAVEAALAGAKLVVTDGGSTKEYFKDKALYIDPGSPADINKKIQSALREKRSDALKNMITGSLTWEKVAERMIEGYRKVLER
ncbi:MAG: glycosyltransferase [Candidatus Omnitrophota bacterium]